MNPDQPQQRRTEDKTSSASKPGADSEKLRRDIKILREMMLTVHYFEESTWLLAAVEFPGLCHSPIAQQSLRRAATIAWQFGFPNVSHWLNTEMIDGARKHGESEAGASEGISLLRPDTEKA